MKKMCMLEENKICDNCLECNICDIDPHKICDNCAKCIDAGSDYRTVEIDEIIFTEDLKKKLKIIDTRLSKQPR